jgi:hypothetical protein
MRRGPGSGRQRSVRAGSEMDAQADVGQFLGDLRPRTAAAGDQYCPAGNLARVAVIARVQLDHAGRERPASAGTKGRWNGPVAKTTARQRTARYGVCTSHPWSACRTAVTGVCSCSTERSGSA